MTFVVDGGYFDNSGAGAILDLWRWLEPRVAANNRDADKPCVVPVFLQLDNDYELQPAPGLDSRPRELLIPPQVIAGGIGTHEAAIRAEAAATFDRPSVLEGIVVRAGDQPVDSLWLRLAPQGHPGPQPPLGWALAASSFADMRAVLDAAHNGAERDRLAELLGSELTWTAEPQAERHTTWLRIPGRLTGAPPSRSDEVGGRQRVRSTGTDGCVLNDL